MSESSRIIFLNQGEGTLFREFVKSTAEFLGPVAFLNSDANVPETSGIRLIRGCRYRNATLISRVRSWLIYFVEATWHVTLQRGKPLLFIVTNPPITPILGWLLRVIRKQHYVLLYYDIYPEALIRIAGFSEGSRYPTDMNHTVSACIAHNFQLDLARLLLARLRKCNQIVQVRDNTGRRVKKRCPVLSL